MSDRKTRDVEPDIDGGALRLYQDVKPFTMTSLERIVALRNAVEYVVRCAIPGDIVECGVWKGGSMMAVARTLLEHASIDRTLYLFDTFEGMTAPTEVDWNYRGELATALLEKADRDTAWIWGVSPLEEVKRALRDTGYAPEKTVFVKGRVEDTLPDRAPERIALLRLDTDWYESTYHELTHLYPRVVAGGVLIVDDYGHWAGARRAVDRYVRERGLRLLLNRIDYTGRIAVKLDP